MGSDDQLGPFCDDRCRDECPGHTLMDLNASRWSAEDYAEAERALLAYPGNALTESRAAEARLSELLKRSVDAMRYLGATDTEPEDNDDIGDLLREIDSLSASDGSGGRDDGH